MRTAHDRSVVPYESVPRPPQSVAPLWIFSIAVTCLWLAGCLMYATGADERWTREALYAIGKTVAVYAVVLFLGLLWLRRVRLRRTYREQIARLRRRRIFARQFQQGFAVKPIGAWMWQDIDIIGTLKINQQRELTFLHDGTGTYRFITATSGMPAITCDFEVRPIDDRSFEARLLLPGSEDRWYPVSYYLSVSRSTEFYPHLQFNDVNPLPSHLADHWPFVGYFVLAESERAKLSV